MTARRRRGLLLIAIALASGGLAASQVHERERRAMRQLGPEVEVLVAARDLDAGARLTSAAVAIRRVPARFAPPDVLSSGGARVEGARLAVPVAAGSYLASGLFDGAGLRDGYRLRRGERAVTVRVVAAAGAELTPGARVDVLVSTETGAAGGRTQVALAGAELVWIGAAPGDAYADQGAGADSRAGPSALATLRVTVRQAVYLTAADNFAGEIRLLARPPGDRSRAGAEISQGEL